MMNRFRYIIFIVGFLIFSDSLFSQASVYKPFLKKPSWTVEYQTWAPWSETWAYQKDTTISSKVYQKIVEVTNAASPLVLREDSSLKTIYRYDFANSLEYVYVDFNLIVGNTFVYSSMTGTVTVRDSVLISGQYHNHIKVDLGPSLDHFDWTEGILSKYGPNNYYWWQAGCVIMKVNCMCKNNQPYYSIGGLCNLSCYAATNVLDQTRIEDQISIAPNPSNGIFEIKSQIKLSGSIEVYDVTGRLIQKNISGTEKIDLTFSDSGIYSVILKDDKGVQLKAIKIIKD